MRNWFRVVRRRHLLGLGSFCIALLLGAWLLNNTVKLQVAASGSVDAFLVLGGSISREIYVAQLVKQYPATKVLISQGSPDPCILLIFQREAAPIDHVWLEHCAESTFGNFYFNIPILRQWDVRKVKLITSPTHLPRAKWMAQILLGAQGIWVEVDTIDEQGIPGNQESLVKTGLDLTRSLIWAVLSQRIQPQCSQLKPLAAVNLEAWRKSDFKCEYQGKVD
ncbi:MAG: YdcF family protein [Symploca sp. SIO2C1]|nr:YdcF family protein [Symploca sp. SIO2C1]